MKISEAWLREWVNPAIDTQEIASQLTMLGLEVDSVSPAAGEFDKVIVAKVLATSKHPEADRLTLCRVTDGSQELQIVCGAQNVRPDLMVALATCGAKLPNGMKIKKSKLRGQESHGMLCSADELGLDDNSEGILELPEDAPLGQDVRDYLHLNDSIFDIDLTPNRADCFSVLGVAREIATKHNLQLNTQEETEAKPVITDELQIDIQAPDACPVYAGCIVKDINSNADTPIWMKERLRRGGIRTLHPVVDVLNYVMLEFGQPMHAFDLDVISDAINVRYAKSHEKLTLLNGQDINLSEDLLIIADANKPIALAGIMGGADSAVSATTTNIFIESAYFNPTVIANKARSFGLTSDASQRYERGVDPKLAKLALIRATSLILQITGGKLAPISQKTENSHVPTLQNIEFNPARVKQLIGIEVAHADMQQTLQNLGMQVDTTRDTWQVMPPSYRFDICIEEDLVEEIARVYGFDKIESTLPSCTVKAGKMSENESIQAKAASFFANRGYRETISYSFVDPEVQELLYPAVDAKKLINPISPELSVMRVGLWPGLIASMVHNVHRQQSGIKLFEIGSIFNCQQSSMHEEIVVGGLITGEYGTLNWSEQNGKFDFYDAKGDLEALFAMFNVHGVEYFKCEHAALHPGKSASLVYNNQVAGMIGVMHPSLVDAFDLSEDVVLFELPLNLLTNSQQVVYQTISKYPQTRRDLSLLVAKEVSALELEKVVREVVPAEYLKAFDLFDVYVGETIPVDKKSVAIALTIQDNNGTLVDEKINGIMDSVLDSLTAKFAVALRSIN